MTGGREDFRDFCYRTGVWPPIAGTPTEEASRRLGNAVVDYTNARLTNVALDENRNAEALRNIAPQPSRGGEIPEGHIWDDADGGVMTMHYWHRWFAWRPVWLENHGWVWLQTIERRFSTRSTPDSTTVAAHHRLIGSGGQLADANTKKD